MGKFIFKVSAIVLVVLSVTACTPATLAMGAGATVGSAALQEGGIKTATKDTVVKYKIIDLWLKQDFEMFRNLDVNVKEGRVLITGSVQNPDMRVEAVRLAWQIEDVKQVLNEITVEDEPNSIGTMISDSVIAGSLRTRIMFDKEINSLNYNIDTNRGNIYIMGIARSQEELDKVIDHARKTNNAKNVVNYVRLREESLDSIQN